MAMSNPNRHAKFVAYWESLGKPQLEVFNLALSSPVWKPIAKPTWAEFCEYRIAGDVHWELRRQWVDSDKKLPIQFLSNLDWFNATDNDPSWYNAIQYRAAPAAIYTPEEREQEKQMSGTEKEWDALIHNINTAAPGELVHVTPEQFAELRRYSSTIKWGNVLLRTTDEATNTPEHYQMYYKGILLDPARIAKVYNITDHMQFFALKKCLKAGKRGFKDIKQDIRDIIQACNRWLEMLEEEEEDQ